MKYASCLLLLVTFFSFGQCPIDKGQGQFNAGFGFSTNGVPVYVGFDYGLGKDISVGGEFSFRQYRSNGTFTHNIIGIIGNVNYHFNRIANLPSKFDVYLGLNLGYYVWNSPSGYLGEGSRLGLGGQLGGRYYFNDHFGANLEFGGGLGSSGGKVGISYRF